MAIESAADLASIFDADAFGRAATYTPADAGTDIAVVVILDEPDKAGDLGVSGMRSAGRSARMRAALLPADEKRGGILTLTDSGEAFDVRGVERDISGSVAILRLSKAAS